ncbi:hypothetical protein KEM54_004817 [Ascosphaera aggregata]|nr:hypothetical protein KEM54_004817 [Ascosphaera aggregata]
MQSFAGDKSKSKVKRFRTRHNRVIQCATRSLIQWQHFKSQCDLATISGRPANCEHGPWVFSNDVQLFPTIAAADYPSSVTDSIELFPSFDHFRSAEISLPCKFSPITSSSRTIPLDYEAETIASLFPVSFPVPLRDIFIVLGMLLELLSALSCTQIYLRSVYHVDRMYDCAVHVIYTQAAMQLCDGARIGAMLEHSQRLPLNYSSRSSASSHA